jgi:hypothetical protein
MVATWYISYNKSPFGYILEGLELKMFAYFMAIWNLSQPI